MLSRRSRGKFVGIDISGALLAWSARQQRQDPILQSQQHRPPVASGEQYHCTEPLRMSGSVQALSVL